VIYINSNRFGNGMLTVGHLSTITVARAKRSHIVHHAQLRPDDQDELVDCLAHVRTSPSGVSEDVHQVYLPLGLHLAHSASQQCIMDGTGCTFQASACMCVSRPHWHVRVVPCSLTHVVCVVAVDVPDATTRRRQARQAKQTTFRATVWMDTISATLTMRY
jgi:hypothetical protein